MGPVLDLNNLSALLTLALDPYTVQFAAQGFECDVTVFSSSDSKKEDAMKMGAKHYVNTSKDDWTENAGEDFEWVHPLQVLSGDAR